MLSLNVSWPEQASVESWHLDKELKGVMRYGRRASLVERKVSASMCPGGEGIEGGQHHFKECELSEAGL